MITQQTISSPIETSVSVAPMRFKIKASARAFKILSGFYTEPLLAIPRELGANAWDSHVKAGNTSMPFEVHAPSQLEPWFSVRDYGTGLSPSDVEHIYTTYFESTKTADNDSDGCMGLGSKTPFNYTENFTVTSWFGGEKRVYNCFIDEYGAPNIMHLATEPSREHTGVQVKFAVKIADISSWVHNIKRAYSSFKHRPNIVGANITFDSVEYLYKGARWGFPHPSTNYKSSEKIRAYMGNYCYPVKTSALRNAIAAATASSTMFTALKSVFDGYGDIAVNLDLFFEIGELEVAPNKEDLQYEDENITTKNLIRAIDNALKELRQQVTESIGEVASRWEALAIYDEFHRHGGKYYYLRRIFPKGDVDIRYKDHRGNVVQLTETNLCVDSPKSFEVCPANPQAYNMFQITTQTGIARRTRYIQRPRTDKVLFFYTTSATISRARLNYYVKTHCTGNFPLCYAVIDSSPNAKVFHAQMRELGVPKNIVINLDTLPLPPRAPRVAKQKDTDTVQSFVAGLIKKTSGCSETKLEVDSNSVNYYIDFLYSDPVTPSKRVLPYDAFRDIVQVLVERGVVPEKDAAGKPQLVIGLNAKNRHLLKTGKWINVFDLASEHVKQNMQDFEQQAFYKKYAAELHQNYRTVVSTIESNSFVARLNSKPAKKFFSEFCKEFWAVNNNPSKISHDFFDTFGVKAHCHTPMKLDIKEVDNVLDNKYMGILRWMDRYSSDRVVSIAKVIDFIEEKS